LTGAVTGNGNMDGSGNLSIATTLAGGNDNHGLIVYEPNEQIYGTVYEGQVNGLKAIGTTSITVDGCTPTTGTFLAGQKIFFGNSSQEYVIQSDVTCVSGACTIVVSPALVASVADNAIIYFMAGVDDKTYTFTVPSGVTSCIVTCVGGGGGGATGEKTVDSMTLSEYLSGGAGDVAYRRAVTGLTPGQEITVTVGRGGNGCHPYKTDNATAGNASSFGAYVSASGGGKAVGGSNGGTVGQAGGDWASDGNLSTAAPVTGTGNVLTYNNGNADIFADDRVGFGGQNGYGMSCLGTVTKNTTKMAGQAGKVIVEY